jgi:hypothetical protein
MKACISCDRCEMPDGPKNAWGWLCIQFPQDEIDPVTGGVLAPYKLCRDVRKITVPNQAEGECAFYIDKPPEKIAVVKEGWGGKSVTFENKEVA